MLPLRSRVGLFGNFDSTLHGRDKTKCNFAKTIKLGEYPDSKFLFHLKIILISGILSLK